MEKVATDAVIFDMDGVLIDSEPLWKEAQIRVFRSLGIEMTREMCAVTMGYRTAEVIEYWYTRLAWEGKSKTEVTEALITTALKMIAHHGKIMKGVQSSLEAIKNSRLKIGLASSSPLRIIETVIDKLNIRGYFDVIHSAEKELYGKPHPVVFLSAAEKMAVFPGKCLVIEDSVNGVIAAKAARMKVIAVPDPVQYEDKRFGIADYKLASLQSFDINDYLFI